MKFAVNLRSKRVTSRRSGRCVVDTSSLRPAALPDALGSIAAMQTVLAPPQVSSLPTVVRMRIIASMVLILMCLLAVWSSTHSDASTNPDASATTAEWANSESVTSVFDETADAIERSIALALPAAAVALCVVGVCVAGLLLERRYRLVRSQLVGSRKPRRPDPRAVRVDRPRPVKLSLTELSLSRT